MQCKATYLISCFTSIPCPRRTDDHQPKSSVPFSGTSHRKGVRTTRKQDAEITGNAMEDIGESNENGGANRRSDDLAMEALRISHLIVRNRDQSYGRRRL